MKNLVLKEQKGWNLQRIKIKDELVTFQRWSFGQKITLVLKAGKIDNQAKIVFSNGQCHSLALAVNKLTGWPIFGISDDEGDFIHIITSSPKGYLDIGGLNAVERYGKRWHIAEVQELAISQVSKLHGYLRPQPTKAMSFAKTLLQVHFPELKIK